jgi:hypothetical protein
MGMQRGEDVVGVFDELYRSSMEALASLEADVTALAAFASVDEVIPDRKMSAALFHDSASRRSAQLRRCLELWQALAF